MSGRQRSWVCTTFVVLAGVLVSSGAVWAGSSPVMFEISRLVEVAGLQLEEFTPTGETPDPEIGAARVSVVVVATGTGRELVTFLDSLEGLDRFAWAEHVNPTRLEGGRYRTRFDLNLARALGTHERVEDSPDLALIREQVLRRWVLPARHHVRVVEATLVAGSEPE